MHFFRKHISWFQALALAMVLHLFNYSVNLDDSLLTAAGFNHDENEIESIVEIVLLHLYEEAGALPDEANDIDETKSATAFLGIVSYPFNYKSILLPFLDKKNFYSIPSGYVTVVAEICPPPPKHLV